MEKLDLAYLDKMDYTSIRSKTKEAEKGSDKWAGAKAKKSSFCLVTDKMLSTSVRGVPP